MSCPSLASRPQKASRVRRGAGPLELGCQADLTLVGAMISPRPFSWWLGVAGRPSSIPTATAGDAPGEVCDLDAVVGATGHP